MSNTPNASDVMPFTSHTASDLMEALTNISTCPLPVEVFDAFLSEYAKTQSLEDAWWFARCEWDL